MEKSKAVFIDLQGTLGGERNGDIMDFSFFSFSYEGLRLLNSNNYLSIIVTNQGHISKGYFTYKDYELKVEKLKGMLREKQVYIDGIYCCPHMLQDNCTCIKPLPGMIESAIKDFNIDIEKSYIVGDMGNSDMLLAKNTGIRGILVRTGGGEGSLSQFRHTWPDIEPYYVAENILEAIKFILNMKR